MSAMVNPNNTSAVTVSKREAMSKGDLLKAIWTCESVYRTDVDPDRDHRQFLSRDELELVFTLVQRRAKLRSDAIGHA